MALLLFLITAISIPAIAQNDISTAKKYLQELVEQDYLLGVSVAYIQPDGEVQYFSKGSISTKKQVSPTKNTIYEIGSVSKTFTALILARMVKEGMVSLNTPVEAILPDSIHIEPYDSTEITLLHLATHTSGLPRLPLNLKPSDPLNPYAGYTVQEMYEFLDDFELSRKSGSKFVYSNLGMGLLGHLLELKSGMTYEHLLHHYVTEPLKMNSTFIEVPASKMDQFAVPYNYGLNVKRWQLPTLAGAGGIRSTVYDLVSYLKAQMGFIETPLDSAIAMTQRIHFKNESHTIGLGWVYATENDTIIWHNGGTGGYNSFVGWNTEDHTGVLILASGKKSVTPAGLHMLDEAYNLDKIPEVMAVDLTTLASYIGYYNITPMFGVKIFREDGHLMAQATGQRAFHIFPKRKTRFFYKVVKAEIEFIKNEEGEVTQLKLYQGERVLTGMKQ